MLSGAVSIFFTLLYSIQWGKETSTDWVIAMVASFFQSVLLLQPLKVVLVAVVTALCVKKSCDDGYNQNMRVKQPDIERRSLTSNATKFERKIEAIGQLRGRISKFYR